MEKFILLKPKYFTRLCICTFENGYFVNLFDVKNCAREILFFIYVENIGSLCRKILGTACYLNDYYDIIQTSVIFDK